MATVVEAGVFEKTPEELPPAVLKNEAVKLCHAVYEWCAKNKVNHTGCSERGYCELTGDRKGHSMTIGVNRYTPGKARIMVYQTPPYVNYGCTVSDRSQLETYLDDALPALKEEVYKERLGKYPVDPRAWYSKVKAAAKKEKAQTR